MFRAILSEKGPIRIRNVHHLGIACNLGFVAAANFVDKAELPFVLFDGISIEDATRLRDFLAEVGARIEIVESDITCPMVFYRPDLRERPESKSPTIRFIERLIYGKKRTPVVTGKS